MCIKWFDGNLDWLKINQNLSSHLNYINLFNFSSPSLLQYIILLILVFLLELSAGILAYIYEQNVDEELNMTLSDTFTKNYAVSERVTKAVDLMQQNFRCCGAIKYEEYQDSVWLRSKRSDLIVEREGRVVPDSCCVTMTSKCGVSDHPSNIPYTVSTFWCLTRVSNRFLYRDAFTPSLMSFVSS